MWQQYQLICRRNDGKIVKHTGGTYSEAIAKKNDLLKKHKYVMITLKEVGETLSEKQERLAHTINKRTGKPAQMPEDELALIELRRSCGLPV